MKPAQNPDAAGTRPTGPAAPTLTPADWNAFSPARMWRDWIVKSEAQWSESVSQLLKDDRAGEALNRQIGEMQLMHRQFSEFAQASLAVANLPSRSDFEALDERMGRLEDGLAQVAAALSQLAMAISQAAPTAAPTAGPTSHTAASGPTAASAATSRPSRPTRTRQPARPAQTAPQPKA
jgi:hypothetical protein